MVAEIARATRLRLKILLAVAAIRTVSLFEPSRSPAEASSRPPQEGKIGMN